MYAWLPTINHLFPGSGITPWSVRRLTLRWWLLYARQAKDYSENVKKQEREARSRGK